MSDEKVTVFVARYSSPEQAREDYKIAEYENSTDYVATFDIAMLEKDENGKIKLSHKHESSRGLGGWAGFGAGLVVGMLVPPLALAGAAAGTAIGAGVGHFWKGMSRRDVKELGDAMQSHDAALVAVVNSDRADEVRQWLGRAIDLKELETDASMKEIDAAIASVAATTGDSAG